MSAALDRELTQLERLAVSLDLLTCLKDVKAIRDRAEAARLFARSASLSLTIRNRAAKIRLQAERRAGQLLANLVKHGGDRRSNDRSNHIRLVDLGIDHNQSARWQRAASVPKEAFEQYLAQADAHAKEITAQSLLQLIDELAADQADTLHRTHEPCKAWSETDEDDYSLNGDGVTTVGELIDEFKNHHRLLEGILKPVCDGEIIGIAEQRMTSRLLREMKDAIVGVERWLREYCQPSK
jgi:hypothetical protein